MNDPELSHIQQSYESWMEDEWERYDEERDTDECDYDPCLEAETMWELYHDQ